MYDLCYGICSSIKIIMWDVIKHAEAVLQFCFKFDLMYFSLLVSIFLGHMVNLALSSLVLILALPQIIL